MHRRFGPRQQRARMTDDGTGEPVCRAHRLPRLAAGQPGGKPDQEGKDNSEHESGQRQLQRRRQPLDDEPQCRRPFSQRYAEVTFKGTGEELDVLHEPGLIFESRGSDVVDHVPVEVIDITDSENRVVTVYFHQTTKLPVKQTFSWRDPQTRDRNDEVTRFARYREIPGGIRWPQEITRERNGEKIYQIFADSVSINQDLTDDLFSMSELGKKK